MVYKFFAYKSCSIYRIKGVYLNSWWDWDTTVKKNLYRVNASAYKESDLVLFVLANPWLNLISKIT